ncbi:MAG: NAD-dependent epimerase/dehydratase family protein [Armatimonadota bacterium]
MRSLITGGAGFIGSHIAHTLVQQGDQVVVIDDLSSGFTSNLQAAGVTEFVLGSITDNDILRQAMQGVDRVFHHAAIASVPASVADPATSHNVNVTGTFNVLLAARDAGVKSVVFATSSAIYGNNPVQPKNEQMAPEPLSPYAANKLQGEVYARVFSECYGLKVVCLRYFNVYGARQNPQSEYAAVIPKFITAALTGQKLRVFGDGEQSRDFVSVLDVVKANLLASSPDSKPGIYNIGSGRCISLNELISVLKQLLATDLPVSYEPERLGDVKFSSADIKAAEAGIGYYPTISLEEGLRLALDYYRQQTAS